MRVCDSTVVLIKCRSDLASNKLIVPLVGFLHIARLIRYLPTLFFVF